MMKKLRYSNTNTFFLEGSNGGLLIDTDYAGTLPAFFRAIKAAGITVRDISYVMATHYHPDHNLVQIQNSRLQTRNTG